MTVERPPDHVLAAFGLSGVSPVPLGSSWEGGWRCGEVVLSMVADHARAAWSAKVRETLFVDGVRLARPVRSTDGRYVVAGWRADTYVAGTPEPRHDEVVSAAVRLHEATAKLERPRFLTQPPVAPWADVDVFIAADRAAWEERPLHSLPPGARVSPGSVRRPAVDRADQPTGRVAQADQEPQPAGPRGPLRHSAFRRHRRSRHHRHHPVLEAGVLGGGGGGGRRAVVGRGRRRTHRAVESAAGVAADVVARLDVPARCACACIRVRRPRRSRDLARTAALVRLAL